jgi:hypothetical protein
LGSMGDATNYFRRTGLLLAVSLLTSGLACAQTPEVLVRSLYQQVVTLHPGGLPTGAKLGAVAPYLSKSLLHRIELTRACANDWFKQNNGQMVKAPFAWGEAGLFSGQDERTNPYVYSIRRTEAEKDGSFHVYVRFKRWEATDENADRVYSTPNRPEPRQL